MVTRAEHRRTTLLALNDAAIDLFATDGPTVTVDEIAERARVSRRTVFRYVETKEELAFIHPILWFDVFDAALGRAEPGAPLVERLRYASQAIAAAVDADPEPPRRAFLVAASHPELHRGFAAVFGRWIDRISAEVIALDPADHFRARIVGSTVMGMVDAVTREWIVSPPTVTYGEVCDRGFAVVAPLFEPPAH
ncbi:MAG: TetR family transcriptional regulator [Actinomycetota bacterium]